MKKKIFSVILSFVLCVSVFPATVFSARRPDYFTDFYTSRIDSVDMAELENYLYKQFSDFQEDIDISAFAIENTPNNMEALHDLIMNEMVECFNVEDYRIWFESNILTKITVDKYCCTENEYHSMLRQCEQIRRELTDDIKDVSSINGAEKALILHDRLAGLCSYDHDAYGIGSSNADIPHLAATMYGALVLNSAVCQGYSMAYKYLLEAVDIPCSFAESETINHIWNIVYLNGVPYHVDVTWDDGDFGPDNWNPVGFVQHNNFLLSTQRIREGVDKYSAHKAYDFFDAPVDQHYDHYYWQDSNTSFQFVNGKIYFMDNTCGNLYCVGIPVKLVSVDDKWAAGNQGAWNGNYSALAGDGQNLYYNTSDKIIKYNVKTGSSEVLLCIDSNYKNRNISIYGLSYDNTGKLLYDISSSPNFNDIDTIERCSYELGKYKIGDVDFNGTITAADARYVLRYSVKLENFTQKQINVADVDFNHIITAGDARKILRVSVNLECF